MDNMFNTKEFVDKYYEMFEGYDNEYVVSKFRDWISFGTKVLELGFGTGADYFSLRDDYDVCISDYSLGFIEEFKKRYDIEALQIDARAIEVDDSFDVIYSNKVFHVFTDEELKESFKSQFEHLNENGYIFHTLWYEKDAISNEYANNVNEKKLKNLLSEWFEVLKFDIYSEMNDNDSIIVLAKKK